MTDALPKIFVFCNSCSHEWHSMAALSEDGVFLAGHVCSSHGWANHDMGIDPDGWKRDEYAKHYPGGFEVVWVDNPRPGHCAELDAAYQRHLTRGEAENATEASA